MKKTLLAIGSVLMFAAALPLHAQSGCINSPEAPTAILAIAGSAGACIAIARTRIRARRK